MSQDKANVTKLPTPALAALTCNDGASLFTVGPLNHRFLVAETNFAQAFTSRDVYRSSRTTF